VAPCAKVSSYSVPEVSIINRQTYPLSRQLDADAGELVLRKIESMGVKCLGNMQVQGMLTSKSGESGEETFTGFKLQDGSILDADMAIFAIGIVPRDEIAKQAGIEVFKRGGIVVNDDLQTNVPDVYAIGECCSWRGNNYGLIAPGIEMADMLSFNLTQVSTEIGTFRPRKMNAPDLSTKLKLMGVDVASFGAFFSDREALEAIEKRQKAKREAIKPVESNGIMINSPKPSVTARKFDRNATREKEPVLALTYRDPFDSVYKKYIFSADGKHLIGGMMVGDTADYVKMVSIVRKKKTLDVPPSQFIMGAKKPNEADGDDLDDDAQICSCHNVVKASIGACVKEGITRLADIKTKTKAGTGCGGCMPLVTSIFKSEMKKSGNEVSNNLCVHFAMPRADLFKVIKVKNLKTWKDVLAHAGTKIDTNGCEICKPAVGGILSSLFHEHVMFVLFR
jgi:nitrite reductase (NAD(P)H)